MRITPKMGAILGSLACGPVDIVDIVDYPRLPEGTVRPYLNRLEAAGFVVMFRDFLRRRIVAKLTEPGMAALSDFSGSSGSW